MGLQPVFNRLRAIRAQASAFSGQRNPAWGSVRILHNSAHERNTTGPPPSRGVTRAMVHLRLAKQDPGSQPPQKRQYWIKWYRVPRRRRRHHRRVAALLGPRHPPRCFPPAVDSASSSTAAAAAPVSVLMFTEPAAYVWRPCLGPPPRPPPPLPPPLPPPEAAAASASAARARPPPLAPPPPSPPTASTPPRPHHLRFATSFEGRRPGTAELRCAAVWGE